MKSSLRLFNWLEWIFAHVCFKNGLVKVFKTLGHDVMTIIRGYCIFVTEDEHFQQLECLKTNRSHSLYNVDFGRGCLGCCIENDVMISHKVRNQRTRHWSEKECSIENRLKHQICKTWGKEKYLLHTQYFNTAAPKIWQRNLSRWTSEWLNPWHRAEKSWTWSPRSSWGPSSCAHPYQWKGESAPNPHLSVRHFLCCCLHPAPIKASATRAVALMDVARQKQEKKGCVMRETEGEDFHA